MSDLRLVYITTKSKAEALEIGRELVNDRLAACVNVLEGMTSVYRWQGHMEEASEAILIAKTNAERVQELIEAVKRLHSYDVPCAIVLPVMGGNQDYLNWLAENL